MADAPQTWAIISPSGATWLVDASDVEMMRDVVEIADCNDNSVVRVVSSDTKFTAILPGRSIGFLASHD